MRVLIIEDEQPTALRLQKLLSEVEPDIEVLEILDSIESSVKWFRENEHPDLIFQDIHIADGSSFEIYKEINTDAAVIFVTAFDQYAIQAFKFNSVDYLLKPVKREELKKSISKYRHLYPTVPKLEIDYTALAGQINKSGYQKRFVVRFGEKIKAIDIDDIAYFYTEEGNNFFKSYDDHLYPLDLSLDKLEPLLDPEKFFRINRKFIISYKSIKEMYAYSKSRVRIILDPPSNMETIASTNRSGDFKQWLSGK